MSRSDPQQSSHLWVISAAFCTKPSPARFRGSRALRTCLVALCPNPQPHVLTARPSLSLSLSLWVGSLPLGESPGSLGITPHPAASNRLPSGPRGFPRAGVPVRGFAAAPLQSVARKALRARLCRTHAELALDLPEKGVDTVGGWGGLGLGPCGLPGWHERPRSLSTSADRTLRLHRGGGRGKWAVRLGAAWIQPRFPSSEPSAVASVPRLF